MATFSLQKDILVECPFDKSHRIAVRNQIKHIIECEKKIVTNFSTCLYNASHRMARHEFAHHIKTCPDGRQHCRAFDDSFRIKNTYIKPEVNNHHSIESQNPSKSETTIEETFEDNCDEWAEDNCPHYSIYDKNKSIDTKDVSETQKQKLTKNQKKRNRRKAAIASQQTNSIWD